MNHLLPTDNLPEIHGLERGVVPRDPGLDLRLHALLREVRGAAVCGR